MPTTRFERFLPGAGILSGVLFAITALTSGSPPGTGADAAKQVAWYNAHQGRVLLSVFAGALFLVTMGFFATAIRQALRSGETGESTYSSVAYGGALLVGAAVAIWSWVSFAIVEAADKNQAAVVHTLSFVNDGGWLPWTAASAVMMLGTGLGGLRTAALPKWLAVVTIILGVMNIAGPAGIAVYLITPLWLIVTGVVLLRRLSSGSAVPASREYASSVA